MENAPLTDFDNQVLKTLVGLGKRERKDKAILLNLCSVLSRTVDMGELTDALSNLESRGFVYTSPFPKNKPHTYYRNLATKAYDYIQTLSNDAYRSEVVDEAYNPIDYLSPGDRFELPSGDAWVCVALVGSKRGYPLYMVREDGMDTQSFANPYPLDYIKPVLRDLVRCGAIFVKGA